MNRTEKNDFINDVKKELGDAPLLILTDFKGVTVTELDHVRRSVEKAGAKFRVVKNSLCRIAVEGTSKDGLASHFRGNIGVVVSGDDPIATAKVCRTLFKENEKLKIKAGFFDGDILDAKAVDGVADLPSREELLGKLLATVLEGPRQLLRVIQAPARDLLYLLNNYAAKQEESGE